MTPFSPIDPCIIVTVLFDFTAQTITFQVPLQRGRMPLNFASKPVSWL